MTTSQTGAMRTAKPRNDSRSDGIASRLVRLETGNSNEAELASRLQAWTRGRGLVAAPAAATATTGVRSTTVASRLKVAVTTAAATKVRVSIRPGLPRPARRTSAPTALKTPSAAQISATTKMAARNATTGNN